MAEAKKDEEKMKKEDGLIKKLKADKKVEYIEFLDGLPVGQRIGKLWRIFFAKYEMHGTIISSTDDLSYVLALLDLETIEAGEHEQYPTTMINVYKEMHDLADYQKHSHRAIRPDQKLIEQVLASIVSAWKTSKNERSADRIFEFLLAVKENEIKLRDELIRKFTDNTFPVERAVRGISRAMQCDFNQYHKLWKILLRAWSLNSLAEHVAAAVNAVLPIQEAAMSTGKGFYPETYEAAFSYLHEQAKFIALANLKVMKLIGNIKDGKGDKNEKLPKTSGEITFRYNAFPFSIVLEFPPQILKDSQTTIKLHLKAFQEKTGLPIMAVPAPQKKP